jgi:hypothetical protein
VLVLLLVLVIVLLIVLLIVIASESLRPSTITTKITRTLLLWSRWTGDAC